MKKLKTKNTKNITIRCHLGIYLISLAFRQENIIF